MEKQMGLYVIRGLLRMVALLFVMNLILNFWLESEALRFWMGGNHGFSLKVANEWMILLAKEMVKPVGLCLAIAVCLGIIGAVCDISAGSINKKRR